MIRTRFLSLLCLAAAAVISFGACSDNPVDSIGSGNRISVTLRGAIYTFTPTPEATLYSSTTKLAEFGGTLVGTTTRTIGGSFTYDIENGSFPATLNHPVVLMTYVQTTTGDTLTYSSAGSAFCTMTLSASNGTIVDGTFSATLVNTKDDTDKIQITDGNFSVKFNK